MTTITKYSAANLIPQLNVDDPEWNRLPDKEVIESTARAIEARGIRVLRVNDGAGALEKIIEIIPPGSEVMNGSSTTLIEIGYQQLVQSGKYQWKDLHGVITSENNSEARNEIRRKSVTSDYFLSGVNAITMNGELVSCDASGSRVGAWPFAAKNLLLVSGINKIVPTLDEAFKRIREYAYPLENLRSKAVNGVPSQIGKCVVLANERQSGRVTLLLIDERYGY